MSATMALQIQDLLKQMVERKASDLHLGLHYPPTLRIDGSLVPLSLAQLSQEGVRELVFQILSEEQLVRFESAKEYDMEIGRAHV